MRIFNLSVLSILLLFLLSCNSTPPSTSNSEDTTKLHISATFFPLYDLTKSIAGDKGIVESVVPANIEPHDYELTPVDIRKVTTADVFVTMGISFAQFESSLIASIPSSVVIIPAAKDIGIEFISSSKDQNKAKIDPHVWLSVKNAKQMAQKIAEGLMQVDTKNKEYYEKNVLQLQNELTALDNEFTKGLAQCKKNVLLVNHDSFSYLARDYGFTTIHISGLEPEVEPTPLQIKRLIDEAKKNNLSYIMYESLVDPRIAKTIESEVHAEILELNPLEGADNPEDTYVTLMRKNLNNVRIALECT